MDYKWIAQDEDGWICKFRKKPRLDDGCYYIGGGMDSIVENQRGKFAPTLINLETHDYKIEDGILKQVEKTQRCKYADVFIEAANDKTKVLQVKKGETWQDVPVGMHEYRIKPEKKVIKYRNYMTKQGNVKAMNYDDGRDNDWMQWIGDWQDVEI